jgi:hypothetical protein
LRFGFGIRFCNLDFEFLDVVGPTSLLDVKLFILFFLYIWGTMSSGKWWECWENTLFLMMGEQFCLFGILNVARELCSLLVS